MDLCVLTHRQKNLRPKVTISFLICLSMVFSNVFSFNWFINVRIIIIIESVWVCVYVYVYDPKNKNIKNNQLSLVCVCKVLYICLCDYRRKTTDDKTKTEKKELRVYSKLIVSLTYSPNMKWFHADEPDLRKKFGWNFRAMNDLIVISMWKNFSELKYRWKSISTFLIR